MRPGVVQAQPHLFVDEKLRNRCMGLYYERLSAMCPEFAGGMFHSSKDAYKPQGQRAGTLFARAAINPGNISKQHKQTCLSGIDHLVFRGGAKRKKRRREMLSRAARSRWPSRESAEKATKQRCVNLSPDTDVSEAQTMSLR